MEPTNIVGSHSLLRLTHKVFSKLIYRPIYHFTLYANACPKHIRIIRISMANIGELNINDEDVDKTTDMCLCISHLIPKKVMLGKVIM